MNHPNIAAIYGLEQSQGTHYLVLELVPGETLAKRIAAAPRGLRLSDVLSVALQTAAALDAAHEKGIVHRDLKPANMMVSEDSGGKLQIKILDFGLAKAMTPDGGESQFASDLTDAPTRERDTKSGAVLGTAAYMSPEQARGKSVDKRTDIWAFGCVLYEMLSGNRAFFGPTSSDILAAILRGEPNWSALPATAPPIQKLLRRCLHKDPSYRLRDIGDAYLEIQESLARPDPDVETSPFGPERQRVWMRLFPWLASAVLGVLLLMSFLARTSGEDLLPKKRVLAIDPPSAPPRAPSFSLQTATESSWSPCERAGRPRSGCGHWTLPFLVSSRERKRLLILSGRLTAASLVFSPAEG